MKRYIGMLSAAACMALAAGSSAAQEMVVKAPAVEAPVNARAEELRRKAEALYEQPRQLRRAAVLHEREAAARSETDARRVEALDRAARMYAYVGETDRGIDLMQRAARLALRRGDVARAAHAYIDAAFLAVRIRDGQQVDKLIAEADLLALSPLLPHSEKMEIIRRIDPARAQLGMLDR